MSAIFHCYALHSQKTGRRYVGSCESLEARIDRHNSGKVPATRHGVPWVLVYCEKFATRHEAIMKELYYKSGRGRDELDRFELGSRPR
jgi:putative endonuclease